MQMMGNLYSPWYLCNNVPAHLAMPFHDVILFNYYGASPNTFRFSQSNANEYVHIY